MDEAKVRRIARQEARHDHGVGCGTIVLWLFVLSLMLDSGVRQMQEDPALPALDISVECSLQLEDGSVGPLPCFVEWETP